MAEFIAPSINTPPKTPEIRTDRLDYSQHVDKLRDLTQRLKEKKPFVVSTESLDKSSVPLADQAVKGIQSDRDAIWVNEAGKEMKIISINPTKKGGTRGQSAHDVEYVDITYFDGDKRVNGLAVYKPFVGDSISGAVKELVNCSLVHDRGFDTVTPICAITNGSIGYFMSLYRPDINSLDQEAWKDLSKLTEREQVAVHKKLGKFGELLASYHEAGISHQDPQMKNFSESPTEDVIGFDWESAKIFKDIRYIEPDTFITIASHDLEALFSSLSRSREEKGVGLLTSLSGKSKWNVFKRLVFDQYLEHWIKKLSKQTDEDFTDQMIANLGEVEEKVEKYVINYVPILH